MPSCTVVRRFDRVDLAVIRSLFATLGSHVESSSMPAPAKESNRHGPSDRIRRRAPVVD
ncbi:hypothetical protein [Crateriforma conspicua]|uniref:hypothetical protein n=1 Tax=Crateriforma conspicua TaxID=2527996 RepID=UPI0018CCEBE7|nr:hypothetical protein [Crateriforma conspicua]